MSFSLRTSAPPPGSDGPGLRAPKARGLRLLVPGVLALFGILVAGGVAWWAALGDSPELAADDRHPDGFVAEVVPDAAAPDADANLAEVQDDAAVPLEDVDDPAGPTQPPTDPDSDADADEPLDPSDEDRGTPGPRVQPVPWLSLVPPAGSGWNFEVFTETGLPAFEGTQPPDGHLEVFVDDGFVSLQEAVREVELAAARFGATEIGRNQRPVPGADAAVGLLHSVPDDSAPFDQGILLLEVADSARPLIVVMVMFSEGAGPTVLEIEETFASVALDIDALRAAMAG